MDRAKDKTVAIKTYKCDCFIIYSTRHYKKNRMGRFDTHSI